MRVLRWLNCWVVAGGLFVLVVISRARAGVIDSNTVYSDNAPTWLKASRVDRVVDSIQSKLEWDIRKIKLYWHPDSAEFRKAHGFDDSVLAYSHQADNSVHCGPRVKDMNFDAVFGHELVHVILYQKYKGAVPKWLEEGLANYLSNHKPPASAQGGVVDPAHWKVDYRWLATQPARDVLTLNHPFVGVAVAGARYHYQASQALMEMIASHCQVTDLLQLSVGKKLESYLPTLCGIEDLNGEFRKWISRRAGSSK